MKMRRSSFGSRPVHLLRMLVLVHRMPTTIACLTSASSVLPESSHHTARLLLGAQAPVLMPDAVDFSFLFFSHNHTTRLAYLDTWQQGQKAAGMG